MAVGGGGYPPQHTKVGKHEIYRWENLIWPFLVHNFLGPRPPPLPLFGVPTDCALSCPCSGASLANHCPVTASGGGGGGGRAPPEVRGRGCRGGGGGVAVKDESQAMCLTHRGMVCFVRSVWALDDGFVRGLPSITANGPYGNGTAVHCVYCTPAMEICFGAAWGVWARVRVRGGGHFFVTGHYKTQGP